MWKARNLLEKRSHDPYGFIEVHAVLTLLKSSFAKRFGGECNDMPNYLYNGSSRYRQNKPPSILSKRFRPVAFSIYLSFFLCIAFCSSKQHIEEAKQLFSWPSCQLPSLLQWFWRAMEGHVDGLVLEPTAGSYPEVVPWSIQFCLEGAIPCMSQVDMVLSFNVNQRIETYKIHGHAGMPLATSCFLFHTIFHRNCPENIRK